MKEMKRVLALVLCLVMLIGVLPVGALAKTTEIGAMAHRPNIGGLGTGHFGLPDDQDVPEESTEATDPGEETTAPSEETTAPSEETVAPAEDPSEPAADLSGAFGSPDGDSEEDPTEESTQPSEPEGVVARTIPGYVAPAGYTVVDAAVVMSDLHIDRTDDKTDMDAYKQEDVEAVMNALKQSGLPITSVTSAGDMFSVNEDYKGTPTGYTSVINGFIRGTNGLGDSSVAVNYVWSDHDRTAVQEDDKTLLDKTSRQVFANGNYYVYALSMGDLCSYDRYTAGFNYTASSNSARKAAGFTATVDEAIENFKTAAAGMDKDRPLLIVSHQPLFDRRNDNAHAEKWFAAINEVAKQMDVFFFFGHNHKYDKSEDYYYAEDASMPVALDDNWNYQYDVGGGPLGYLPNIDLPSDSKELNFTHLCTGYLEPTSTNSYDKSGTRLGTVLVAVMLVDGNGNKAVNLVTYDANGEYTGKFSQNQLVLCDEINKANVPETPVVPETPDVPQELKPVADTNGTGITVKGEGIEGVAAGQIMNPDYDEEAYTAYAAFEITVSGTYTNGTEATVTVPAPAGFDASKPVQVLYGGEVIATTKIVDGTITFTTDHFSTYAFGQTRAATTGDWVTITAPAPGATTYIYTQATSITGNNSYVIVANDDDVALTYSGTNFGGQNEGITITGSTLKSTTELTEWTFSGATSGNISNGSTYFRYNNNSYSLTTNRNSRSTLYFTDNGSNFRIRSGNTSGRSFYYSDGRWTSYNGSRYVRLFAFDRAETSEGTPGLYGRIAGETAITLPNGTYTESAALQAVKNAIEIQYNSDAGDAYEVYDDDGEGMTWEFAETFDTAPGAANEVVIKYNGVTLGTATVTVADRDISDIEVLTPSITVKRNTAASEKHVVILVTYAEGEPATAEIELPLSALQPKEGNPALNLTKNGTYADLTVTYSGMTVDGITVNVVDRLETNNHPSYPNEGAVKVNKTATGVDFQASGLAQVEISASGVPMKKGVDVIVMLDTSTSMDRCIHCAQKHTGKCSDGSGNTSRTRLAELNDALDEMINTFAAKNPDGTDQDIRVVIRDFNGAGSGATAWSSSDRTQDAAGIGIAFSSSLSTSVSADSFVNVADNKQALLDINVTKTSNGTNYDYAFDTIYQLGHNVKVANQDAGEERDLFVIFMSDGAPNYFNYYASQGGTNSSNDWNWWLTGAIGRNMSVTNIDGTVSTFNSQTMANIVNNSQNYHYYHNETNNQHRMANAVKGDPGTRYEVIRKSTAGLNGNTLDGNESLLQATGETNMYTLPGLGAQMYSIAFTPADDGKIKSGAMLHVLRDIATSTDKHYYEATETGALSMAFSAIANDIKNAAYNARFVDQMGEMYDMRMAGLTYPVVENGQIRNKTVNPAIEILAYEIWTRTEFLENKCTRDMIGTRKAGVEPKLQEVVVFSADGKQAYSSRNSTTTDKNGNPVPDVSYDSNTKQYVAVKNAKNILNSAGIIEAYSFWYNTNSTPVAVEGVDYPTNKDTVHGTTSGTTNMLPGETFYWKLGTIQTSELAMRYYVYLEEARDDGTEPGSYATNEFATLFYDNYLENPCYKDTVSPVLAWKAATISYAFYLVNDSGNPVTMNGVEVGFADRVTIIQPTLYQEILLNDIQGGNAYDMNIISTAEGVLPLGYVLYDDAAKYHIYIDSNGTGEWEIEKGADLVPTTYVTGFNGNAFSCELQEDEIGYDYTNTTVWFAIKMEPKPIPDTIVIDYGLSVDAHVLVNDMFGDYGTLRGVTSGVIDAENQAQTNPIATTTTTGKFGTAKVIAPTAGATEANSVIRYKPFTEAGKLIMNEPEVLSYSVQYANPTHPYNANNGFYHTTLTVIPATTIYYEDEYVELKSFTKNGDSWTENKESGWTTKTDDKYVSGEVVQDEDRPDEFNYGFDISIDANNIYGYDSAYTNYSKYSLGSAAMINVNANKYGTASFDFYGTGFDVISLTSNTTGVITVEVKNAETGAIERATIVDTYYGMNKDGEITDNAADILYQVPVIKIADLPYARYTATITAAYNSFFDHEEDSDNYDFYLDAIRIYDPTGNQNATANDAYAKDGESWPVYQELRNNVISAADFNNDNGPVLNGITFIDGDEETAFVADYVGYGPNNELYLAPGQAIVFGLDLDDYVKTVDNKTVSTVQAVHLAMKAETGDNVNVAIFDAAKSTDKATIQAAATTVVSSATDLYYDITNLKDTAIIVYNNGTGVMSMTNIKITFTDEPTDVSDIFYVDYETIEKVLGALQTVKPGEDADPEAPWVDAKLPEIVKSGKTFEIEGNVHGATSLTVNGETVSFNEDGSWNTSVTLTKSSQTNGVETQEIEIIASNGELSTPITAYVDVYYFEPTTFNVQAVTSTVQEGDPATIKVTTGNDVAMVVVKDTMLTTYRVNKAGTERIWTAEVYLGDGTNGTATADVYVYNAEGHEANTVKTVSVTVNSGTTEGNKIAATVAQTIKKLINSFVDSLSNWFTRSK